MSQIAEVKGLDELIARMQKYPVELVNVSAIISAVALTIISAMEDWSLDNACVPMLFCPNMINCDNVTIMVRLS